MNQVASVLSHDVRSPLRNLHLLTGWLQDDHSADLNADAMEDIQLIRSTTTRLQRLLEDLINYCRVDRAQKTKANIRLDNVLSDALSSLEADILTSGLQLTQESLPEIDCDPDQMVTFFRHVLSNALVHCIRKPEIRISCATNRSSCHIRIADNGVGIEKQYLPNIFTPFNYLHSRDSHEGSGIGLATSKKIIEQHGGTIWLESEIGVGSVVHVDIPLHSSEISVLTRNEN